MLSTRIHLLPRDASPAAHGLQMRETLAREVTPHKGLFETVGREFRRVSPDAGLSHAAVIIKPSLAGRKRDCLSQAFICRQRPGDAVNLRFPTLPRYCPCGHCEAGAARRLFACCRTIRRLDQRRWRPGRGDASQS